MVFLFQRSTQCSGPESSGHILMSRTRRKSSQCPPPGLLLLPGRDAVSQKIYHFYHRQFFPLVTSMSQWDHLSADLVTSTSCLSYGGAMLFQLPNGPGVRSLMLNSNRAPLGLLQPQALRTRSTISLTVCLPGPSLSPQKLTAWCYGLLTAILGLSGQILFGGCGLGLDDHLLLP